MEHHQQVLNQKRIQDNVHGLQQVLRDLELDALYVSSYDHYLNEYSPLLAAHRYYVSGFTGSTAECLLTQKGRLKLYVDGRYHEQADLEVDHNVVEVVKVPASTSPFQALLQDLKVLSPSTLCFDSNRVSARATELLKGSCQYALSFEEGEWDAYLGLLPPSYRGRVWKVPRSLELEEFDQKCQRIYRENKSGLEKSFSTDDAFFISGADSLSWLTNARGNQIPYQSSFLGKGVLSHKGLYLILPKGPDWEESLLSHPNYHFHWINSLSSTDEMRRILQKIVRENSFKNLLYSPSQVTERDAQLLKDFPSLNVVEDDLGLLRFQSLKTPKEIEALLESNQRSDQAIFETLNWMEERYQSQRPPSEKEFYIQAEENYKKQGAWSQSFHTISGIGANSSIIHFGDPSDEVKAKEGDLCLLDSGGYYEAGLATDCTRTISYGPATPKARKIYTLVLKGHVQLASAIIPEGTLGSQVDLLARSPFYAQGLDYRHGTGHGVGIHVHEGGVGISPRSHYPLKPGHVVSIEPGYYEPNWGGVRLENVAVVTTHSKYQGMIFFKPLVYIGFEPDLVDLNELTAKEFEWLLEYEYECAMRGRSRGLYQLLKERR